MISRFMVGLIGYWLTIERPIIRTWRGEKVPFMLRVRLHYATGSRIIGRLYGPDLLEWSRTIR